MAITAKDVADLRAKTGISMIECKKALTEANGNVDEAIKLLREKGLAVAAKKADRIAAEGVVDILLSDDGKNPVLIQTEQYGNKLILSETDYADMNKLNLLAPGDIILFSVYDVDVDALTNSDSVMNVEVISLSCDGYDILSMSSIAHDREILLQENIRNSRILFITEALCFMLAAILLYHKYRKSRKCSANSESNDTADGIK